MSVSPVTLPHLNLLNMQNQGPHSNLPNQNLWGWELGNFILTRSLNCMPEKVEKHPQAREADRCYDFALHLRTYPQAYGLLLEGHYFRQT